MDSVKTILGGLVVIAVLAAIVYLGFINPSMKMDVDESYAWTKNCAEKTNGLSVNGDASESLSEGLGFGRVIVLQRDGQNALIFLTGSEKQATDAESELRDTITRNAPDAFTPEQLSARIIRRARTVFVYGGQDRATPPPGFVEGVGSCVYEIAKNRWTDLIGIDTREIGRPFMRQE